MHTHVHKHHSLPLPPYLLPPLSLPFLRPPTLPPTLSMGQRRATNFLKGLSDLVSIPQFFLSAYSCQGNTDLEHLQ